MKSPLWVEEDCACGRGPLLVPVTEVRFKLQAEVPLLDQCRTLAAGGLKLPPGCLPSASSVFVKARMEFVFIRSSTGLRQAPLWYSWYCPEQNWCPLESEGVAGEAGRHPHIIRSLIAKWHSAGAKVTASAFMRRLVSVGLSEEETFRKRPEGSEMGETQRSRQRE